MKCKIVIIEDNVPLAQGFAEAINKTDKFIVVNLYDNCEDAIINITHDEADIYLMDIELLGVSGIHGTKRIKQLRPEVIILMVTVHENSTMVFDALCAGATGYLTKGIMPEQLITALEEAVNGGAPMSINIAKMVVSSFQKKTSKIKLSEREREVLTLLSEGNSYRVIADRLFISKNTIKFHLKKIYSKLQVNSNVMAVQKANEENLL